MARYLIALLFGLSSCTVVLRDERIDAVKLNKILEQHSVTITSIAEQLDQIRKEE